MPAADSREFDTLIAGFDPAVQELARAARALIFDVLPQTVEVVWINQQTAGYGTGPKKMSEYFCWIAPYRSHIGLGFNYGSELARSRRHPGRYGQAVPARQNQNAGRSGKSGHPHTYRSGDEIPCAATKMTHAPSQRVDLLPLKRIHSSTHLFLSIVKCVRVRKKAS